MPERVLVTRKLKSETLQRLYDQYEVDVWDSANEAMPRGQLLERVKDSVGILCMLTDKIDTEALDAAGSQLRAVSTMSVGFDHVDAVALKERNIELGTTPGVLDDAVADLTIALMLNVSRRMPEATAAAENGEWGTWSPYWLTGQDLSNSTVGIIGMGAIGAAVARRLSGFGCTILYSGRSQKLELEQALGAQFVTQDELLAQSDFVSIHTALTDDTAKMCNVEFFTKMKSSAVFVNTGRGGLVDQDALYGVLKDKRIFGAGIDVTDPEPLPTDHPLFRLDNCTVLPHIGSASIRTREAMAKLSVENLLSGLAVKQ